MLISGFALLGICALTCFILSLLLVSERGNPFEPGPAPAPTVARPFTETLIIRANETAVPPAVPIRLTIGNNTFDVLPLAIDDQKQAQYDPNNKKAAYWVPGTLVNYVIGLHASSENRSLIDSLKPEDLITLDTALGAPQRYRVVQQATIRDDDTSVLQDQTHPQLTLVMLGQGGSERRIVISQYTDEGTPNQLAPSGATVNLGDVRVTTLGERLVPGGRVGLPEGSNYYQVDIAVTNLISRVLDASQFYTELIDGNGDDFALSTPGSSAAGATGWMKGALQPGQTITATAGFEVPSTLAGPNLEWRFATDRSTPYIARVAIPYRPIVAAPTSPPTKAPLADVNILNATITPEGNELRIVGTIRNLTDSFQTVSLKDVSLSTGGNLSPLNGSLPGFPWSIASGETLAFQLSFARPAGSGPAIFTLLGQGVEISGF